MKEEPKKGLRKVLNVWGAVILIIVVWVIAGKIIYGNLLEKNDLALNSYSKEAYDYLDEIAENTIVEGEDINILDIINYNNPEIENALKVAECETHYEGETVILSYCLNNNKDIKYALPARMKIVFSKEGEILSQEPNFSTEEEYVESVKISIGISAGADGMLVATGFALIEVLFYAIRGKKCENQENDDNLS